MSKLLFEDEFVRCELEADKSILKHTWLKKPSSEEFRNSLMNLLDQYKAVKGDFDNLKWLANTIELGELTEKDEVWLDEEWDHLIFQDAGVKNHAVVLGSNIFADFPMEMFKLSSIQKNSELGVELEVFSSEEKAYEWLAER